MGGDGFWTTKLKFIGEGRFVPCYTYEKPNPVALGTYDAVVRFWPQGFVIPCDNGKIFYVGNF